MTRAAPAIDVSVDAAPDTIASLIARQVRANPAAPAVLAPDRPPLAYAALARQIAQTGIALAAAGFGRGHRIAVVLANGPETATALVGTMCCATCVPINPAADEASLRSICERLRVDAAIVADDEHGAIVRVARALAFPLFRLSVRSDAPAGTFALRSESARRAIAATAPVPDDVVMILHTSGTTGRPKGVPLTHRNQVQAALLRQRTFGLDARDRALCVSPMFTATGIRRNLLPLFASGASVVCPRDFDAERILRWLADFEPTLYAASPAVHRAVVDAIERCGGTPRHRLRYVFSGGSPLAESLQMRLEQALGVPLIETYAMSEVGVIAQNPFPPGRRKPGSVGLPVEGEVAIVDESLRFLARGETGEIVVRGAQVFGGYFEDPEADRNAFFDGWFRTGDIGCFDADGYLYLSGRQKEMINRGGFKVPPQEVDAALLEHPAVAEAATFGVPHATLGEDVLAAIVPREGAVASPQALRDFVFGTLADFKVPSRIVVVDALPRSPLGKVSRAALAEAFAASLRPSYRAPRDAREAAVAGIFAEILEVAGVGADDNFFTLGGDSLRGARVANRANALFQCRLTPEALFRRPTVAEFAAEIALVQGSDRFPLPPIVPIPRPGDAGASRLE